MLLNSDIRKNSFIFVLGVSMICLVFSKYVLSMSLIGILILIVFLKKKGENYILGINPEIFRFSSYKNKNPFFGFLLYFFWITLSIFWSIDNPGPWFHDVVGKLSIPGLLFIFCFLPILSQSEIRFLHYIFYSGLAIASFLVLYIYIPNQFEMTTLIARGRPIPAPLDHVRFSMMSAFACLSSIFFGINLWFKRNKLSSKKEIWILLFISVYFFLFTHILSVRSGIFLLYSGLIFTILFYVITKGYWKFGILSLFLISTIPFLAFKYIPSFKQKVGYVLFDLKLSQQNNGTNYSDSDRIRSIKNGLTIWKENKLLGLGAGDYKLAFQNFYKYTNQAGRALLPHNQWIRTGSAYGLVGILFLLSGFVLLLYHKNSYRNLLVILITQLFFFSFLVESNMERYYALVFFLLFIGLATRWNDQKTIHKSPLEIA